MTSCQASVCSTPITGPCHYGIDTPNKAELIATNHSLDEVKDYLGVDSLGYLSLAGMLESVDENGTFCSACFSGNYPAPLVDHAAAREVTLQLYGVAATKR